MATISAESRARIASMSSEEKRLLMVHLAAEAIESSPTLRTFRDDKDKVVGYFVPAVWVDDATRAEVTRRLDTPGESLTLEEMLDRAGKLINPSNAQVPALQSR